ncbi:MAG TPA: MBL fold metallo-hydrolase [Spirochaetia bacterium]|nr:MBL fold metallo-hydrolase [Spirochaetia bacterium]
MRGRFWGVRGSHPTPMTPDAVRSKIASVIQRVRPQDLENSLSRESFLAALPRWLFGSTGGNTPCIEVRLSDGTFLIFDTGSGIRELSAQLSHQLTVPDKFHIFYSHFHYDHVQGLPFFAPAYNPRSTIRFYSPVPELRTYLNSHMRHPYFPVTMEERMSKSIEYHTLTGSSMNFGSAQITWRLLNHPGGSYAYRIDEDGRSLVIATDTELLESDFEKNPANISFFRGVDLLILDTQYTLGEAIEKFNWGHSSFSLGVDFATVWEIKQLYLFHHEPLYDDKKLHKNLQSARWYAHRLGNTMLQIHLSEEGMEFSV